MIVATNHKHIYRVLEDSYYKEGYYFEDETEDFGNLEPYETTEEALEALEAYTREMLRGSRHA